MLLLFCCSDSVESDLELIGLIIFENKLKPETTPVIRELNEANIRTVMVTGGRVNLASSFYVFVLTALEKVKGHV